MALDDKGHALDGMTQEIIRIFNAAASDYENVIRTALNIPVSFPRAGSVWDSEANADDESEDGGMFV